MKNLLHSILLLTVSACSLVPDFTLPKDDIPEAWRTAGSGNQVTVEPVATSWGDFGNTELNALIARALEYNSDMQASLARVEQARASTIIASSGLFPQMDASASLSRDRSVNGNNTRYDTAMQAGLGISYELDLWQRNANSGRSAEHRLEAAKFDRKALSILVASETARLYTGALALNDRYVVAEENLKAFRYILRITQARYDVGAISGLELAQQKNAVASTEASAASIANQRDLFINQLALVTGMVPAGIAIEANSMDVLRIPIVDVTDPWQLLERRPDIARAEASLKSANIDIGVARANALPSLSLGLDTTITGSPASNAAGLVGSFFAPIFHGGALQAEIKRREAVRDEELASYRGVLLTAFREVEDSLSNYAAAEARSISFAAAAVEARKAYTITRAQYDIGAVDFQALLNNQQSLLQAGDSELSARQALFAAVIDLFRALGGPSSIT